MLQGIDKRGSGLIINADSKLRENRKVLTCKGAVGDPNAARERVRICAPHRAVVVMVA
jgi:hypothetical protein